MGEGVLVELPVVGGSVGLLVDAVLLGLLVGVGVVEGLMVGLVVGLGDADELLTVVLLSVEEIELGGIVSVEVGDVDVPVETDEGGSDDVDAGWEDVDALRQLAEWGIHVELPLPAMGGCSWPHKRRQQQS